MLYYTISDIHGDEVAMLKGLQRTGYDKTNPNHQIISLGDNFGRASTGGKSKGVFKYLTSKEHINPPICIRGNHESILLDVFRRGFLTQTDIYNGEALTISSFAHCNKSEAIFNPENVSKAAKQVEAWIMKMPWYYETEHYIFTHGWLPADMTQWDNLSAFADEDWHEATWCDTMYEMLKFIHNYPEGWKKHLVVGHWTASEFISYFERKYNQYGRIYTNDQYKITFCDCTTAYSHNVDVFVVEDE